MLLTPKLKQKLYTFSSKQCTFELLQVPSKTLKMVASLDLVTENTTTKTYNEAQVNTSKLFLVIFSGFDKWGGPNSGWVLVRSVCEILGCFFRQNFSFGVTHRDRKTHVAGDT